MSEKKALKRSLLLLLVGSLCFNLFFAGAYIHTCSEIQKLKTPEGRNESVVKRLKLSKDQMERFVQLEEQLNEQTEMIKKDHRADIEAFWREAMKDNPDSQKVRELLDRLSDMRGKHGMLRAEILLAFLKVLTPEQKKLYVEMFRKKEV